MKECWFPSLSFSILAGRDLVGNYEAEKGLLGTREVHLGAKKYNNSIQYRQIDSALDPYLLVFDVAPVLLLSISALSSFLDL